jgi:hypothetical protein
MYREYLKRALLTFLKNLGSSQQGLWLTLSFLAPGVSSLAGESNEISNQILKKIIKIKKLN